MELPEVPEGMFWRVGRPYHRSKAVAYISLIERIEEPIKFDFWSLSTWSGGTKTRERYVGGAEVDHLHSYGIKQTAEAVLRRKKEKDRDDSFFGDYPPKKLSEVGKVSQ